MQSVSQADTARQQAPTAIDPSSLPGGLAKRSAGPPLGRLIRRLRGWWAATVDYGLWPGDWPATDPDIRVLKRLGDLDEVRRALESARVQIWTSRSVGPVIKRRLRRDLTAALESPVFDEVRRRPVRRPRDVA